jgi:hypothetical protein
MIKLFSTAIALFIFSGLVNAEDWYTLESKEHGYKVEFPKEPEASSQEVETEIGVLKMNMYMYDASKYEGDENMIYMVNYSEYPEEHISSDKTELLDEFFRNSIDGAVTNVSGELLSEKKISMGKFPGREIRIDYANGAAVITMRIYLVKNAVYMVQAITDTKNEPNKSVARFMDSLELTSKQ